jgi:SRSO17 transposase
MTPAQLRALDRELTAFLSSMVEGMGRPERREAMSLYLTGLLLDGSRKSTQPMAVRLAKDADDAEAIRQRLQQCVAISTWEESSLFRRVALKLDAELPDVEAFVVDDTGFPKKGTHSVGVTRQYSGTLGRVDNCQVAVSLHLAGERGSGCIDLRLYLSEEWAGDAERRKSVGVPEDVQFKPKWQLALDQLDTALASGVEPHDVLADAGYGDVPEFRDGLTRRKLRYVVGVNGSPVVWRPESRPAIPTPKEGHRGPPSRRYRDDKYPPVTIEKLALELKYRKVTWREGTRGKQASRFAAVRIRTASRHLQGGVPGEEQWLLAEWPEGEEAPTKYWLSTLPAGTALKALVRKAKLRWRVERDYQDLKEEVGLDHFEGRTWRGFHHHAALCATAHAFLALRRALFPPAGREMDPAAGTPPPAAVAHSQDRSVPVVPAPRRLGRTTSRASQDVIR